MLNTTKDWIKKNLSNIKIDIIDGISYPKKETILNLHDFLIEVFKEDEDDISLGINYDATLDLTGVKYFMEHDEDLHKNLILRAAHIFNYFLEATHPFTDGNKRTGFVTLWLFLTLNEIKLFLPLDEYESNIKLFKKWADLSKNKKPKNNIKEITH